MISKVNSAKKINLGEIRIVTNSGNGKLPQRNALVMLKILEKRDDNIRMLVNGKVFKSTFPIAAKTGEEFIGRVQSVSPFVIGLNQIGQLSQSEMVQLQNLLAKLKIKFSKKHLEALKLVIEFKKPLEKERIKRLFKYCDEQNYSIPKDVMAVVVDFIWNNNSEEFEKFKAPLKSIFDITFEELSKQIFNCISLLYNNPIQHKMLKEIKKSTVINLNQSVDLSDFGVIRDKSKQFEKIVEKINKHTPSNLPGGQAILLNQIASLMVKYILQKALLNDVGIRSEFVIIRDENNLELFVYKFIDGQPNEEDSIVTIESKKIEKDFVPAILYSTVIQKNLRNRMKLYSEKKINIDEILKLQNKIKKEMDFDSNFTLEENEESDEIGFDYKIPKLLV